MTYASLSGIDAQRALLRVRAVASEEERRVRGEARGSEGQGKGVAVVVARGGAPAYATARGPGARRAGRAGARTSTA